VTFPKPLTLFEGGSERVSGKGIAKTHKSMSHRLFHEMAKQTDLDPALQELTQPVL